MFTVSAFLPHSLRNGTRNESAQQSLSPYFCKFNTLRIICQRNPENNYLQIVLPPQLAPGTSPIEKEKGHSEVTLGVIRLRLERRTVCLEGRCSIQLSYRTPCRRLHTKTYSGCACKVNHFSAIHQIIRGFYVFQAFFVVTVRFGHAIDDAGLSAFLKIQVQNAGLFENLE